MGKLFVGDVGTEIILDCGVDITSASVVKILVRKPGVPGVSEWVGTIEGTTQVKYTTKAGDLNAAGLYLLQAHVTMPTWSGKGETATLQVFPPFAA